MRSNPHDVRLSWRHFSKSALEFAARGLNTAPLATLVAVSTLPIAANALSNEAVAPMCTISMLVSWASWYVRVPMARGVTCAAR